MAGGPGAEHCRRAGSGRGCTAAVHGPPSAGLVSIGGSGPRTTVTLPWSAGRWPAGGPTPLSTCPRSPCAASRPINPCRTAIASDFCCRLKILGRRRRQRCATQRFTGWSSGQSLRRSTSDARPRCGPSVSAGPSLQETVDVSSPAVIRLRRGATSTVADLGPKAGTPAWTTGQCSVGCITPLSIAMGGWSSFP